MDPEMMIIRGEQRESARRKCGRYVWVICFCDMIMRGS